MATRMLGRVAPLAHALAQSAKRRSSGASVTARAGEEAGLEEQTISVRWVGGELLKAGQSEDQTEVTGETDFDR